MAIKKRWMYDGVILSNYFFLLIHNVLVVHVQNCVLLKNNIWNINLCPGVVNVLCIWYDFEKILRKFNDIYMSTSVA